MLQYPLRPDGVRRRGYPLQVISHSGNGPLTVSFGGSAYWHLLHEPAKVLLNAEQWPTHFDITATYASTREWAAAQVRRSMPTRAKWEQHMIVGGWHSTLEAIPTHIMPWTETWPLPVGRSSLVTQATALESRAEDGGSKFEMDRYLGDILPHVPFAGEELAGFVLMVRSTWMQPFHASQPLFAGDRSYLRAKPRYNTDVTFFGLVKWDGVDPPRGAGSAYCMSGYQDDLDAVADLWRAFRRWWSRLEGKPLGGRPTLDVDEFANWRELTLRAIEIKSQNPRLKWEIIADLHIGVHESTLRRWRNKLKSQREI